jgi:hypothetical protein
MERVKLLCGYGSKNDPIVTDNPLNCANELNAFFARFDVHNHKTECETLLNNLKIDANCTAIISQDDVLKSLKRVKVNKSCGPDKISGKVLKSCADQLCEPLRVLYQLSLDLRWVPALWKLSEIIPVPKVKFPKVYNDYRPVALTSLVMKCFEHIVKRLLCMYIDDHKDPLQFAYCKGRSVQDATLPLMHNIFEHLEFPNSSVRVLFVDFSSAFNTIQNHLLITKHECQSQSYCMGL